MARNRNRDKRKDEAQAPETQSVSNPRGAITAGVGNSKTAQFVADTSKIPFSNVLGLSLPFGSKVTDTEKRAFPGVMGLQVRPVPGDQQESDSPVNVAARDLMSEIRAHISGTRPYDSPNIMLYIMMVGNLYTVYAHCARMYGLSRQFSPKNRYYPKAFFDIIGWDYDDFVDNKNKFREFLNTWAEQLSSFCCPADLPFVQRQMDMYKTVYVDGMTSKAQTYFFYPEAGLKYVYDTADAAHPIQLQLVPLGPNSTKAASGDNAFWKVEDVVRAMRVMMTSLVEKEDIATMSGDLLKTFGFDRLWSPALIPEDYGVAPEYNEGVLLQIHNAVITSKEYMQTLNPSGCIAAEYADLANKKTWLKTFCRCDDPDVGPMTNWSGIFLAYSVFAEQVTVGGRTSGKMLLNCYDEDPTPEQVMHMIRFMPAYLMSRVTSSGKTALSMQVRTASEVIVGAAIAVPAYLDNAANGANVFQLTSPAGNGNWRPTYSLARWSDWSTDAFNNSFAQTVQALALLFDWFPHQYSLGQGLNPTGVNGVAVVNEVYSRLENYTLVDSDKVFDIHYAEQLMLFDVPKGRPI